VGEIEQLEERRDRIQQQLSRLEAARQFEAELRQLVTQGQTQHKHNTAQLQHLLAKVDQLATALAGQGGDVIAQIQTLVATRDDHTIQLLSRLENILQDLATQTNEAELQQTLGKLQQEITQRYRWQGELAQLESLQQQLQANQRQQAQVQTQLQALVEVAARRGPVEAGIESLQGQIKQLGYPREKSEILQRTLAGKANLESSYSTLLESQAEQDQTMVQLTTALDQFRGLDQTLTELQQCRSDLQTGYTLYLQHQNLAARHPQLQQEWEAIRAEEQALAAQLQKLEQDLRQAEADFDHEAATALEQNYQTLKSEADQLSGRLPEMQRRQQDMAGQIKALEAVAQKRDLAQKDLKKKEKAKRFINFARKVYKEAGPRITEQYARAISYQADKLFRDLIGRQNVALEWTRDYEIVVQEGANRRRFINLSGGEQMCAALAVRLALLKVLADIDIAFFDEPTTNMDRARRESLAEAIGRIKTFQQLFVISHDDTFEQVTENVIVLERDKN